MMELERLILGERGPPELGMSMRSRGRWDASLLSFLDKAVGDVKHQFKRLDDMSKVSSIVLLLGGST